MCNSGHLISLTLRTLSTIVEVAILDICGLAARPAQMARPPYAGETRVRDVTCMRVKVFDAI